LSTADPILLEDFERFLLPVSQSSDLVLVLSIGLSEFAHEPAHLDEQNLDRRGNELTR
jgi:hypothetical protein